MFAFNLGTNTSSLFASTATLNLATNAAVGSTEFTSPDNTSIDAEGNVYIVEDRNGAVDNDI